MNRPNTNFKKVKASYYQKQVVKKHLCSWRCLVYCSHSHIRSTLTASAIAFVLAYAASGLANPVINNVAAGKVTINQTTNSTVVNQASHKAIINWNSFNIGSQELTHFQQPNGGVALNRINSNAGAAQIFGRLTATGRIILIDPAGIYFGPGRMSM